MAPERRRLIPPKLRQMVRSLAELLPPPRDAALLAALRSILDLIRGRPPHRPRTAQEAQQVEILRLSWRLVDVYNRLGFLRAREVFRADLAAWTGYAVETVPNLEPWPTDVSSYESDTNRLRFRRTLDFVIPGDRVFDVGFGRGYLCGLLFRDGDIGAYHGIDVVDSFIETTRQMIAANRLEGKEIALSIGDLYELSPSQVAEAEPSLMICSEVLEHVPDPERALELLAECLPKGAELQFSVPLYRRLEAVWGHRTVFDVNRLLVMVERAGLHVHHVEPLANQWAFVIASHSTSPATRVIEGRSRGPRNAVEPLTQHHDFQVLTADEMTVREADGAVVSVVQKGDLWVQFGGQTPGDGQVAEGQLGFSVPSVSCVKLDLMLDGLETAVAVRVELGYRGRSLGGWTWDPTKDIELGRKRRKAALRPDEPGGSFVKDFVKPPTRIDEVSLRVVFTGGVDFDFRAAFLP